jgi:hypothetical protein
MNSENVETDLLLKGVPIELKRKISTSYLLKYDGKNTCRIF